MNRGEAIIPTSALSQSIEAYLQLFSSNFTQALLLQPHACPAREMPSNPDKKQLNHTETTAVWDSNFPIPFPVCVFGKINRRAPHKPSPCPSLCPFQHLDRSDSVLGLDNNTPGQTLKLQARHSFT